MNKNAVSEVTQTCLMTETKQLDWPGLFSMVKPFQSTAQMTLSGTTIAGAADQLPPLS
jgi:hypothetical protein